MVVRWQNFFPVHLQRITLMDVGVGCERQEVHLTVNDALRLLEHLRFGNPDGRLSNGDSKVIDLDAVELRDLDLNGIEFLLLEAKNTGTGSIRDSLAQDIVLETAQGEVGLRQEVAGAAGRISKVSVFDTIER